MNTMKFDNFFSKYLLVHNHIEKSAGTTLVDSLVSICGYEHVYDTRPGDLPDPSALSEEQKSRVWALTGHFHNGAHESKFSRKTRNIAIVRNPISRFISFYSYVNQRPDHPGYDKFGILPIDEAVEYMIEHNRGATHNEMCRAISGGSENYLDALNAIEKDYLIVIPNNKVNELAADFASIFEQDIPDAYVSNRGVEKKPSLSQESIARLVEVNRNDIILNALIEDGYKENRARMIDWLSKEVG